VYKRQIPRCVVPPSRDRYMYDSLNDIGGIPGFMLKYPRMRGLKTARKTSFVDQHSVSRVKVAFQPIT